ncbi:MAG: (d)CMP kinase [Clostridia bacterium]|nr:(d)CMP kinase [Clostridia bacterium]
MFVITIDGKAGSGKSTIAQGLSERLKIKKLNTGAIYRGITCEYLEQYKDVKPTEKIINNFLKNIIIKVEFNEGEQNVIINGTNFTSFLREERVSNYTPLLSGYDNLREKVRQIQREFAQKNDCIVEGRDIGRVVLPSAQCKFFFTASVIARAKRRYNQIGEEKVSLETIKKDIEKRDEIDTYREFGAMLPAKDAIIIDNSNLTIDQTLDKCQKIIENKLKIIKR